jgi:hypothetical protein
MKEKNLVTLVDIGQYVIAFDSVKDAMALAYLIMSGTPVERQYTGTKEYRVATESYKIPSSIIMTTLPSDAIEELTPPEVQDDPKC